MRLCAVRRGVICRGTTMLSVWNHSATGFGAPRAYVTLALVGVSFYVLSLNSSRLLSYSMLANAAEDHPSNEKTAEDVAERLFSSGSPRTGGISLAPHKLTAAAHARIGGVMRSPANAKSMVQQRENSEDRKHAERRTHSRSLGAIVVPSQNEDVSDEGAQAYLSDTLRLQDARDTSKSSPWWQPRNGAREDFQAARNNTEETSQDTETVRVTPQRMQSPSSVSEAPTGVATPPASNGELGQAQEVQEDHGARLQIPEADILKGRSRYNTLNSYATSLTDKFAEKVATLTAQVDMLRMDVVRARDAVQGLNDAFDARTEETLRKIEERSTQFSADLSRLEKELEWQLNPHTGMVSKRINELRQELLKLRLRARNMFEKEATVYVQQIESCNARADSLTEIYFDLKSRTHSEIDKIEAYMVSARRKLEETMQEQLNILTETEREAAARASQRFKSFLKSLRLEGNVLQSVVKNIQQRFMEPQATFASNGESSTRKATYIDMSGLFASSRVEKVCVVVTQLVKELLEGRTVVPIFIHTISRRTGAHPPLAGVTAGSSGRLSKRAGGKASLVSHSAAAEFDMPDEGADGQSDAPHADTKKKQDENREATLGDYSPGLNVSAHPAVEMVLPSLQILERAASLWLRERQEYGLSYDHYAVIRIEGYLMEYFTVPFLEYHPYFYATEGDFATVNTEQFEATLKSFIEEKLPLLEAGLQKQVYLLIAYVGAVTADEDTVRPRPSLVQTDSRATLARKLSQNIKPRSPSMYFIFQYLQRMLHFTDQAEQLFRQGAKKRSAIQVRLPGDDIRVVVLADDCKGGADECSMRGSMITGPREDDPFFRGAFAVLRLTLKRVAPDFLVFPSDYLLAVALDQLVWEVTGGSRPPGPLSLFRVRQQSTQKSFNVDTKKWNEGRRQWPGSGRRQIGGVLISTGSKIARGWSVATPTASLSLLEQRRRGPGTPVDSPELMNKEAVSDEVTATKVLRDSAQHAVRVSFTNTLEEVARHTVNVMLRAMRGKLDYLARGYTLYVYVYVV